jgi:protein O-mannosyl-transferase
VDHAEPGADEIVPRHAGLVIALTAAGCYLNAALNGFALDDNDVIARNPLVQHLGVGQAFLHTYWPESTHAGQYRPLAIASFAIDWALSHGAPIWLHVANIGWHVVACLLLWRLLATMLAPGGAVAGAILFALHPVHVEAVANLVGRIELMCTAFILAALLAHRRRSLLAIPLYAAALLSKETGITFLGLAAATDLLLRPQSPADAGAGSIRNASGMSAMRASVGFYGAYAVVTALYAALLGSLFRGTPLLRVAAPWVHTPAPMRWLTAIAEVPQYLRLLFFPFRLHVDYMPRVFVVADGVTPSVAAGAILIVIATVGFVRTRRLAPPIAFAIALFGIAVAPVSNLFFASGIMLAERTLYLPSVAVAIGAGWLWDRSIIGRRPGAPAAQHSGIASATSITFRRRFPAVAHRPLVAIVFVLAGAAFAVRTWTRNPVWRNNKTAIVASLRDEPESYRAHERAADVLERAGDTTGALREYGVARSLYPGDPYLYQAAASMLVVRGDSGAARAEGLLDSAQLVDPGAYADMMRHAWLHYAARDYRGAIVLARRAYMMQRDSTDAIMVLTEAAQRIDDVSDASAAYRLAIGDHPHDRTLHRSYATMLWSIGDTAAAVRERQMAGGDRY